VLDSSSGFGCFSLIVFGVMSDAPHPYDRATSGHVEAV
jgi:hypothetical protein